MMVYECDDVVCSSWKRRIQPKPCEKKVVLIIKKDIKLTVI